MFPPTNGRRETSQMVILPMTPHPAGEMPDKKCQGLGKSVRVGRSGLRCRDRLVWSGLVGLAAIGFEVPEIDSSGLVGLAAIGFEVPEIDSSGLVGLAVIGFKVPEIDLSGLVSLAVLVQPRQTFFLPEAYLAP